MKGFRHLLCVASLPYSLASNVDSAFDSVHLQHTTLDTAESVLLLQTTVDVAATVDAGGVNGIIGARPSSGYDVGSTARKAGNGNAYVSSDHGAQSVPTFSQQFSTPRLSYAVGPDAAAYDEIGMLAPVKRQEHPSVPLPRATAIELAQADLEANVIELADRLGKLNGILHTQFSSPYGAARFSYQAPPDATPTAPLLVPASSASSASVVGSASASVVVSPEYIETPTIPSASMAAVATELAHKTGSVSMELSQGTGSVATESTHGTGSLAAERAQVTSSLAMELAHRTGSFATEVANQTGSLAKEVANRTGSLAMELAQGTGTLAMELKHMTNSRNGLLVAAVLTFCILVLVALCFATCMQSMAFGVCVTGFQWFPSLRRSLEKQSDFLSDSGWQGNVGSSHEVWVRRG